MPVLQIKTLPTLVLHFVHQDRIVLTRIFEIHPIIYKAIC